MSAASSSMFPTVSGDVELPKTFVNSLRILFDILDEDKDGLVPVSEIELRWQGDGISGLPNGVLQSLRKVAPENGALDFDLFCSALKLTLRTNKERSRSKEQKTPNKATVKPNNVHPVRSYQSVPQLRVHPNSESQAADERSKRRVSSPPLLKASYVAREEMTIPRTKTPTQHVERVPSPKSNARRSYPPTYSSSYLRMRTDRTSREDSSHLRLQTGSRSDGDKEKYGNYATVSGRLSVTSPHPQLTQGVQKDRSTSPKSPRPRPSSSSISTSATPTENKRHEFKSSVVKSPPPYMAHVKPQSHKVVKAQLVYPQENPSQKRSTSAPPPPATHTSNPKRTTRRRKEEPRRHTLSNGIPTDFNALKRMKDLEQEKDVLHQGLDLLEKCKSWYQDELILIKEQQHQLISGKEMGSSNRQDRVVYRTSRIMDINRQMRALMSSTDGFPDHMNLAMPERIPTTKESEQSPLVQKLKDQNKKLTQEVSMKGSQITALEREKATLIRQLFDVRGKSHSRDRPENVTLL